VTVNTDFAETEVDARQINLTRFPLFFPEKRTFFLEGAGIYDVAGLGSGNQDLIPFFSRRIGLLDRQEVPILFGVKVSGRESGPRRADPAGEARGRPGAGTEPPRRPREPQPVRAIVGRADRHARPSEWFRGELAGRGGCPFRDVPVQGRKEPQPRPVRPADGRRSVRSRRLRLRLQARLSERSLGRGAQLEAHRQRLRAGARLRTPPRDPEGDPGHRVPAPTERFEIRQFFFELRPDLSPTCGRVENWRTFTAPFNARTESGEHLEWNYIPTFERLDAPFEIQPGIIIPAGSYQWTRYRAEVNTATKRAWVADFAFWWGSFYGGRLRQYAPGLTLKPNTHLALAFEMERDEAELPQGDFVTQVFSARLGYNFSPDLTWSNLVQYDSESRIVGFQSRFRWILRPGNDLFLVVGRGWFAASTGITCRASTRGRRSCNTPSASDSDRIGSRPCGSPWRQRPRCSQARSPLSAGSASAAC
jgi:hypothetical protein